AGTCRSATGMARVEKGNGPAVAARQDLKVGKNDELQTHNHECVYAPRCFSLLRAGPVEENGIDCCRSCRMAEGAWLAGRTRGAVAQIKDQQRSRSERSRLSQFGRGQLSRRDRSAGELVSAALFVHALFGDGSNGSA